jgi:ubiquinone/menaquinone biosynthesis C-methylase UbiE/uncharacterized protein YbaR (Trm112 family)
MDQHTSAARQWLDRRYSRGADGRYKAHQPIRGLSTDFSEPNARLRLARTYKLLDWMRALRFDSVLDIGGGEGYLAALIRDLFAPKVVQTCDLSVEANLRAWELFGVSGVSADASRLPFGDATYDLVVCSEVIEHLSRPALAIGELMRVARKYVVVSTAEFSPLGEFERRLRVLTLDRSYPHAELNWFTPGDFTVLMGDNTVMSPQYKSVAHQLPLADHPRAQMARIILFLTDSRQTGVDQTGVIAVQARDGSSPEPPLFDPVWAEAALDRLFDGPSPPPAGDQPLAVDAGLESRLQCPRCGGSVKLQDAGSSLSCVRCSARYQITGGVPVMLAEGPGEATEAARETTCAARLAAGRRDRQERIVRVMARLHDSRAGRHGAFVHWIAGQSLRILWLFGRPEPWTSRLQRIGRRLFGIRDGGDAALVTALAWTASDGASPGSDRAAR